MTRLIAFHLHQTYSASYLERKRMNGTSTVIVGIIIIYQSK